jgi:hypothetical protein
MSYQDIRPGSPEWSSAWAQVREFAEGCGLDFDSFQYLGEGAGEHAGAHAFRIRAGMGGNNSGVNRWVFVRSASYGRLCDCTWSGCSAWHGGKS